MATEKPFIEWDKDAHEDMPKSVTALVREGWKIKQEIDSLTKRFKAIGESLAEEYTGAKLEIPGEVRVAISMSESVSILDVDALAVVLGKSFEHFVEESVAFKPKAELKAAALDEDHDYHEAVLPFVDIKYGNPACKFSASK